MLWVCSKRCFVYLRCILPAVDHVLGACWSARGAPVKMKLSGSVAVRQAGDVHLRGQRYLYCGSKEVRRWLQSQESRNINSISSEDVSAANSALPKSFFKEARDVGVTQGCLAHARQCMMNVYKRKKTSVSLFQTHVTLMMPLSLWRWGPSGMHT